MDKSSNFMDLLDLSEYHKSSHSISGCQHNSGHIALYTINGWSGMSRFAEAFWSWGLNPQIFLVNPWINPQLPLLAQLRVFILSGCYIFNHAESLAHLVYLIVKLNGVRWSFSNCFLFSQMTITDLSGLFPYNYI